MLLAAGMGTHIAALLPDLPTVGRTAELSARARLQATLARASAEELELVADLAAAVVARRG